MPREIAEQLPKDLPELMKGIAAFGDVGLVVLDPISGMLPANTNTNLDTDVRSTIAFLNVLADMG